MRGFLNLGGYYESQGNFIHQMKQAFEVSISSNMIYHLIVTLTLAQKCCYFSDYFSRIKTVLIQSHEN